MSKGQSKVTDGVDVEDYHEDQVAASNNKRQMFVRNDGLKGCHVLKHDKGIDVNNCNTEVFASLERSLIEDGHARGGSAMVACGLCAVDCRRRRTSGIRYGCGRCGVDRQGQGYTWGIRALICGLCGIPVPQVRARGCWRNTIGRLQGDSPYKTP